MADLIERVGRWLQRQADTLRRNAARKICDREGHITDGYDATLAGQQIHSQFCQRDNCDWRNELPGWRHGDPATIHAADGRTIAR